MTQRPEREVKLLTLRLETKDDRNKGSVVECWLSILYMAGHE